MPPPYTYGVPAISLAAATTRADDVPAGAPVSPVLPGRLGAALRSRPPCARTARSRLAAFDRGDPALHRRQPRGGTVAPAQLPASRLSSAVRIASARSRSVAASRASAT